MDAHIQVLHLTERVKSLEYGLQEVLETHQINDKSASEDFVLFLIDGNRFQFHEKTLAQKFEGGAAAAVLLLNNILPTYLEGLASGQRALVHVYANLRRTVASERFAAGFSSQPLCGLMDCGAGPDNARWKIADYVNVVATNPSCRRVILAADCTIRPDLMEKTVYVDDAAMSMLCQTQYAHDSAKSDYSTDSRAPSAIKDDLRRRLGSFATTVKPFHFTPPASQIGSTDPSDLPSQQPLAQHPTPRQALTLTTMTPSTVVKKVDPELLFKMRLQSRLPSLRVVMPADRKKTSKPVAADRGASRMFQPFAALSPPEEAVIHDSGFGSHAQTASQWEEATVSTDTDFSVEDDTSRTAQQETSPVQMEDGDLLLAWD